MVSGCSAEPEPPCRSAQAGRCGGDPGCAHTRGGGEVEHVRLVCTAEEAQVQGLHAVLDHRVDGAHGDVVARLVVHQAAAAPSPAPVVTVHTAPS